MAARPSPRCSRTRVTYAGDITMFSAKPGNQVSQRFGAHRLRWRHPVLWRRAVAVTVGTEGPAPGADAGLITQGGGNIQIYSQKSILLGLSRIMTTFGGDILAWSD